MNVIQVQTKNSVYEMLTYSNGVTVLYKEGEESNIIMVVDYWTTTYVDGVMRLYVTGKDENEKVMSLVTSEVARFKSVDPMTLEV